MSKLPAGRDQSDLYAAARRVLLDALVALEKHRDAIVLIGAQAVYVRASTAQLGVAAYTSDGDLGIDPDELGEEPLLQSAMIEAGFTKTGGRAQAQPGIWWKTTDVGGETFDIPVDLLVPEALSSGGRRSAKIPPHDSHSVLRVPGIEVAMEDRDPHVLRALEPDDDRAVEVNVAGVAALLVAKAFKLKTRIDDRERKPERLSNKDASDVVGLMIASDVFEITETFERLISNDRVGAVARQGLVLIWELFGVRRAQGVELAIEALGGILEPEAIMRLTTDYVAQLPRPL